MRANDGLAPDKKKAKHRKRKRKRSEIAECKSEYHAEGMEGNRTSDAYGKAASRKKVKEMGLKYRTRATRVNSKTPIETEQHRCSARKKRILRTAVTQSPLF